MENRHWLLNFFRWDARAVIAASLGLLVIIGLAWAATDTLLVQFDFGGASLADKAVGAVAVKGGLTAYPQTTGSLQFGWTTPGVTEYSDNTVSDLIKRDYNGGSSNAQFRISGLEQGTYTLKAVVGATNSNLSTRIQVGELATAVSTSVNTWRTASLVVQVDTGTINLVFNSDDGLSPWGICGLAVYSTTGTVSQASFEVSVTPIQQTVTAGNPARFNVGVTELNNYGSSVKAQISGLVNGMTAEFSPAELAFLPGTMELTVYTAQTVPATNYALVITVVGRDTLMTQKATTVSLIVKAPDVSNITPINNQPSVGTNTTNLITPDLPIRSPQETAQDFASIDQFAAEQQKKALSQNNFLDIKAIGDALSPVPVFEGLPKPTSTTEFVLQSLVQRGIISSTTDSAPAVQQPAPRPGFWQGLWQSIFRPTS